MKKDLLILLAIISLASSLRFFKLASFPPGLYSDETAIGYNAFALLKTGRDEFGKFLPLTFRSFGDYKPPLSSYLMILPIAIFGLNEFAVRFPFAIIGASSVILIYFLAKEFFSDDKHRDLIALLAAILLAVYPWHLHQSRMAMLVGLEAFLNALGIYLFLKALRKPTFFILSAISFSLAIYAYYGSRITVPLLIVGLVLFFKDNFLKFKKNILMFSLGFLALVPLFYAISKDPETLLGRARYMSIFYDRNVKGQIWEATTFDAGQPTILTRILHNKPYYYAKDIIRRWLSHFDIQFLFLKGEEIAPFQIPNMGLLYLVELPFLISGIVLFFRQRKKERYFLLYWFLISPFVASLTFMTPASNRSFNMVFPAIPLTAFGLVRFLEDKKFNIKWIGLVIFFYLVCSSYYFYQYYHNIGFQIPLKYHYGRKELVEKITKYQNNYDTVILSDKGGPPYIFLLFFKQFNPIRFRETVKINPVISELGWGHIDGFDKYLIPRDFNWQTVQKVENSLYIGFEDEVPDIWQESVGAKQLKVRIIDKVFYPNGKIAFKIFDLVKP